MNCVIVIAFHEDAEWPGFVASSRAEAETWIQTHPDANHSYRIQPVIGGYPQ